MANSLDITLSALATVSSGGAGTAVDLGTVKRRVAKLELNIVSGTISIQVETSPDSTTWRVVRKLEQPGTHGVEGLDRYVRATWTATASVTWELTGTAHAVYCEPKDLWSDAVPKKAIEDIPMSDLVLACIAATSKADGWVGNAYVLPLVSWGESLTEHTALLAVARLFRRRGADPNGPDLVVFDGEKMATRWFERLGAAKGGSSPPDIVDSTPETYEGGSVVLSGTSRGW